MFDYAYIGVSFCMFLHLCVCSCLCVHVYSVCGTGTHTRTHTHTHTHIRIHTHRGTIKGEGVFLQLLKTDMRHAVVERRGGGVKSSQKPDVNLAAGAERRHVYDAFFWSARMLVARNG